MKVLVFTSLYPNNMWPRHGVFIQERVTHFASIEECKVKVIAPVPYFPPIKINYRWRFSQVLRHEIRKGLEVHHPRYFMIPKVGMLLQGWMMFLSMLPPTKEIQKSFDFELIDAHYLYPDGFAAVLLGRFFRKPVVVSARGTDVNLFREFPLIRKLLRYTLSRAEGVIAVSEALKRAITDLGIPEGKTKVIPNGVDAKKFNAVSKQKARQILRLPDKKVLLSVGHLVSEKGFDLLIKAVRVLTDEFQEKNLSLIIVGGGERRKELQALVSSLHLDDVVFFAGEIAHEDLRLWYSAADLFCLASSREGWPNVLLESLICGTPVVATSVGGVPEIIRSDEIGLLAARDERDLAEKISEGLKKKWDPEAISRYAAGHTWERAAQSVVDVFTGVLNNRGTLPRSYEIHPKSAL